MPKNAGSQAGKATPSAKPTGPPKRSHRGKRKPDPKPAPESPPASPYFQSLSPEQREALLQLGSGLSLEEEIKLLRLTLWELSRSPSGNAYTITLVMASLLRAIQISGRSDGADNDIERALQDAAERHLESLT